MKCDRNAMRLYAVTDSAWVGRQSLCEQVACALKGGATCIQLREKEPDGSSFSAQARAIKALCRTSGVPFIVNDHLQMALQCGADGIHIGQHDMDARQVRASIGGQMILGVSVQTVEQALRAVACGADYLGVGAVFATSTKADADAVSHDTLRNICAAVRVPVVAIGGIGKDNILQLAGTGIDGVALVSAIFGSADIEEECRALRALSERMVAR